MLIQLNSWDLNSGRVSYSSGKSVFGWGMFGIQALICDVYFDQNLVTSHSKCWYKYPFSVFFPSFCKILMQDDKNYLQSEKVVIQLPLQY